MISYNFYKNIVFQMPLICFSWVSGWSGQTTYDIYLQQVFNLVFACFPIIVFAVYDQEYPKKELLERPGHYSRGFKENHLSWTKYFSVVIEAVVHGTVVFFLTFVYFEMATSEHGQTNSMRSDGSLCYVSVVLAVTFKIIFDSHNLNILVFLAASLSILSYFAVIYTITYTKSSFPELDIDENQFELKSFIQQYFVMFFLAFAALPFS